MKKENCALYEAPHIEVLDILAEGVLCGSVPPGENEGVTDEGNLN